MRRAGAVALGLTLLIAACGGSALRPTAAGKKIKPLLDWTEAYESDAEQAVPSPPGICVAAG